MKKWEYMIKGVARLIHWQMDPINKLGEEGWEAVGVYYNVKMSETQILFKREKV